ncbi:Fc.00g049540.m01.CDS01 [Cosmosporella sp. VM-42]
MSEAPDQMPGNQDAAPKAPRRGGGKRQPLSCLACRQHKLRCDRRVPCSTCIRYRREAQCRQNPAPSRRTRRALSEQVAEESVSDFAGGSIHDDTRYGSRTGVEDESIERALGSVYTGRRQPQEASNTPSVSEGFASLARLLGLDAGMDGAPSPSLPQIMAEANRVEQLSSWWSFLDMHHRKRLWRQQLSAILPSRSQCDLLTNYYLEHINWIFQTVHVPSFRREYSSFWDTGVDQVDLIWLSLLLTVISVSALYVPLETVEVVGCPRDSIRHLAHVWHLASQHALRAGEYEAKPCLTQLQTFSVTQLYWYATNNIETMNSHLGQAIRNAQAINLDRDTSPSTCLRDELRHRIWWDLVDSDMFQTICLDRQPLIRLQHPGVPLPLNCDDDDITETTVNPRPMDEPTTMSMNIFRAQLFQILNRHFCAGDGSGLGSYESILALDAEILGLVAKLPWYFQLNEDGLPPRMPEPLCEVLTWQNHILRTCVSTQRIRMYRPFLSARIEDAWNNIVKAANDSLVVYRTLRTDRAPTSHQKFFAQAYQVFSVAVTVAALLLVEGSLPIPNVCQQIKDMAMDLKILEDQGCPVPVATHGRQVLLKMLALCDSRATNPTSPEDAQRLVPDISVILGGENTTRAYMGRLASQAQMNTPTTTISPAQNPPPLEQEEEATVENAMERNPAEISAFSPQSLIDPPWGGMLGDLDPDLFLEDARPLGLLNWDMTGLLADAQNR